MQWQAGVARKILAACLLPWVLLLSGCMLVLEDPLQQVLNHPAGDGAPQVYKLYPGSPLPDSALARLELGTVDWASIDGLAVRRSDYQQVQLLPGPHALVWREDFAISVMVDPAMQRSAEARISVELQAGHAYRLHAERSYGVGYQLYFWIEDLADGRVLGGRSKP